MEQEFEVEKKSEDHSTEIWECTDEQCNGWMRKAFSLEESPVCPICQSAMRSGMKEIPKLKKRIGNKSIFFGRGLKH